MLCGFPDFKILGEASDGKTAVQIIKKLKPDVVLLDLKLPDISGLEVTKKLLRIDPDIKILIVTAATNNLFPFRLLKAGAKGYLTKSDEKSDLIQAIQNIYEGQHYLSTEVANKLALSKIDCNRKSNFDLLTDKELEIMHMIIQGQEVKDIAAIMNLSPKTIHTYRGRIGAKLKVKNNVDLVFKAIEEGIVTIAHLDKL